MLVQIHKGLRMQISSCHLLKKATDLGCVNVQTSGGGFLERDTNDVVSGDRESNPHPLSHRIS